MRLDKFIAENTGLTRSQATKAIRQSAVKINGEIEKTVPVKFPKRMKSILKKPCSAGWKVDNILC
ncbi:ribosomal small subunit pseudouridine synthase A [Rodentibacter pneumotropicus]|uniref:Ribosomal small subunit pseudouridine synthase A n=1 Tax=Rodentibacter pneumotropicus TaxID=758 RepID=A0A3S4U900_9PAST|nr:ribosomal small subunit pseudouridine synthase A [Rodentibacter pneumotropicus]